jgi:hypothetical protein
VGIGAEVRDGNGDCRDSYAYRFTMRNVSCVRVGELSGVGLNLA